MARARNPNSADSQFFIVLARARHLDGQYTVWGKVKDGMEFGSKIKKANQNDPSGMAENPDVIIRMQVASDVKD